MYICTFKISLRFPLSLTTSAIGYIKATPPYLNKLNGYNKKPLKEILKYIQHPLANIGTTNKQKKKFETKKAKNFCKIYSE